MRPSREAGQAAGHITRLNPPLDHLLVQQGRIAFAALAIERRPLSHDQLADVVWDDQPPGQWKSALAAVISKTRSLITTTGLDGTAILVSSGGAYALRWPAEIWVDIEDALRRLDRAKGAVRHGNHAAAAPDATVASSILRRPLLTGIDNVWADRVRDRLGDHQLAATAARTAIELDPLRELAHRLLIEAERARGDEGAALRAHSRCVDILKTELGATPSPETLELAYNLGAGRESTHE